MNLWKFLFSSTLWATFAVQPALAGQDGNVIEVVTFKLKAGVAAAEFASIDKAVEREHVTRQPGFVSRESAHGADGEWLVIVHWRSAKDADASMTSFEKAPAAAPFMSKVEPSTMVSCSSTTTPCSIISNTFAALAPAGNSYVPALIFGCMPWMRR